LLHSKENELSDSDDEEQGQVLSLKGLGIKSLDFLAKFLREHPNITDLDLQVRNLSDKEMQKFAEEMKANTSVKTMNIQGVNMNAATRSMMRKEMEKNKYISSFINQQMPRRADGTAAQTLLDLKSKKVKSVGFLSKYLQSNSELQVLDLSDNSLDPQGAKEITELLENTRTLKRLNLSHNKIGPQGLQYICSALCVN